MEWNVNAIISLGALGIALVTIIDRFYGSSAKSREKVHERMTVLENRIVALETKTGPFWRVLEEHMVDLLKQPTHLKLDGLLDRYKQFREDMGVLELKELKYELLSALEESKVKDDRKSEGRTFGYVLLLGIIESRISEKMKDVHSRSSEEPTHV
jgi:hypothetical protein